MGGLIADIVVLIYMLICVFIGYRKGITGSLFKIASFLIAIIFTVALCKPVSNIAIEKTHLNNTIKTSIVGTVNKNEQATEKKKEKTKKNEEVKEQEEETSEDEDITEEDEEEDKEEANNEVASQEIEKTEETEETEEKISIFSGISEKIKGAAEDAKDQLLEETAMELANKIVNIVVAVLLYIAIRLILLIVGLIFGLITGFPAIDGIDKFAGIIFWLAQGAIIVYIIFSVVPLISVIDTLKPIEEAMDKSLIGHIIYQNNIIFNFFSKH